MTAGASWALQKGVYETLIADTALTGLLGGPRVFDDVPDTAAFPYLTIGDDATSEYLTFSDTGFAHAFAVHVWSRASGRGELKQIAAAVIAALHDAPLVLEDNLLVNLGFLSSLALRESDGRTYHGIVRFRAVTEPTV